ncbi:MAG: acyltransferase [Candidatus Omnitrophica bacterium]|nr:acyltransferase [Candidatus Omnitrophota bacterium]
MKRQDLKAFKDLDKLHKLLRNKIKKKWNRVLPFNEEIGDRWEKAKFLKFAKGASIYDSSLVFGDVKVGENTWVGPFTVLDGTAGLEIGSYCSISTGVQIYTHDSLRWALSGGKKRYEYGPVKIGDRCYFGPNAIVSMGVTIGDRCVIGTCSFVDKDIPGNSIVFGIPAKIVGKVVVTKKGKIELKFTQGRKNEKSL